MLNKDYKGKVHDDLITISDVDIQKLNNGLFGAKNAIFYKDVLLFTSIDKNLDMYKLNVIDETKYMAGFVTIRLIDSKGDSYHYGRWQTINEFKEWLKNPSPTQ